MDNQASSGIVNQDSVIEETPSNVEVLPATNTTPPPNKSDLDSRFNIGWRKGAEILLESTNLMPIVGSAIKIALDIGDNSSDERLKEMQFSWVVQEVEKISHKLDILIKTLPFGERITPADVASTINAAMKASEKTADAKKRKLLKNAVVNAFDVEQYKAGLTLRLFKILENVEYGDVEMLRRVEEASKKALHSQVILKEFMGANSSGMKNVQFHHLEILAGQSLILIWNHNTNIPLGVGGGQGCFSISELGEKFLEFVKEAE